MRVARGTPPDARALFTSACAEVKRHGPTRDYFRLLDAAAAAGSIEAASDLGEWLLEGHRVRRAVVLSPAPKRAVELLRRAAAQGHPSAVLALANCYADGVGTPRNLTAAA